MSLNQWDPWTPLTLKSAINSSSVGDGDSALDAAAILCDMVRELQIEIAELKKRVAELEAGKVGAA